MSLCDEFGHVWKILSATKDGDTVHIVSACETCGKQTFKDISAKTGEVSKCKNHYST